MTGEQLERTSYDNHNTIAECAECGARFDVEDVEHGVSIDGDSYCCPDCMTTSVKIDAFYGKCSGNWIANAELSELSVCISNQPDKKTALKEAFELAEINWEGIPAYIEVR